MTRPWMPMYCLALSALAVRDTEEEGLGSLVSEIHLEMEDGPLSQDEVSEKFRADLVKGAKHKKEAVLWCREASLGDRFEQSGKLRHVAGADHHLCYNPVLDILFDEAHKMPSEWASAFPDAPRDTGDAKCDQPDGASRCVFKNMSRFQDFVKDPAVKAYKQQGFVFAKKLDEGDLEDAEAKLQEGLNVVDMKPGYWLTCNWPEAECTHISSRSPKVFEVMYNVHPEAEEDLTYHGHPHHGHAGNGPRDGGHHLTKHLEKFLALSKDQPKQGILVKLDVTVH
mmetsp:Transcript_77530/g.136772  ORF Transcript_77530/g.136772 Transcript_77530/m.136772 type:complete len:282 (-) Transcript_77530:56-901(-)